MEIVIGCGGAALLMLFVGLLVKLASCCFYIVPKSHANCYTEKGGYKFISLPFGRALYLCWPPCVAIFIAYDDEEIPIVRNGTSCRIRLKQIDRNSIRAAMRSMRGNVFTVNTRQQFRSFMQSVAHLDKIPNFAEIVQ